MEVPITDKVLQEQARAATLKEVYAWGHSLALEPNHYHDGWQRRDCPSCMDRLFDSLKEGKLPEEKPNA